jgi:hypothetical protein
METLHITYNSFCETCLASEHGINFIYTLVSLQCNSILNRMLKYDRTQYNFTQSCFSMNTVNSPLMESLPTPHVHYYERL